MGSATLCSESDRDHIGTAPSNDPRPELEEIVVRPQAGSDLLRRHRQGIVEERVFVLAERSTPHTRLLYKEQSALARTRSWRKRLPPRLPEPCHNPSPSIDR